MRDLGRSIGKVIRYQFWITPFIIMDLQNRRIHEPNVRLGSAEVFCG